MSRACSRTTSSTSRPSAKGSPKSSRASSGTTSRRARRSCCSRAACGCPHGSRPGALPTKVMRRTSARATSSAPSRWWRCGGLRADCGAPLRRPPRSDAPSWAACCSSSPVSWGSSSPPGRSRWPSRSACTHWNGAARGTRTMADPQPPWEPARIAQQDEADLVARAVAGERAAFGMLVERYAGVARRVARAVLGNPEDADDAAQDAMLSALVKLEQYDARRPFGPWLLRIVANAATDRRRRRSVRRVEPLDVGLTAGGARPDATAERRALNERLRQALAELPERRRMAVVLFDVEGYSHGEIALILGIPEGTVRSEVFHARRRLRVLLADWKEEG